MQFYILSPLVVYYMARAQNGKAIYAPIVLAIVSLYLRAILFWKNCPGMLEKGTGPLDPTCMAGFMTAIYTQTYTRMGPYGFGMYAAYVHLSGAKLLENSLSIIIEWIAFLSFLLIPFAHMMGPIWE